MRRVFCFTFVLAAFLVSGCGEKNSPTAPDPSPPTLFEQVANTYWDAYPEPGIRVQWWFYEDGRHWFVQSVDGIGRVAWEAGGWWEAEGVLHLDREEGQYLSRDGITWLEYASSPHRRLNVVIDTNPYTGAVWGRLFEGQRFEYRVTPIPPGTGPPSS